MKNNSKNEVTKMTIEKEPERELHIKNEYIPCPSVMDKIINSFNQTFINTNYKIETE